MVRIHVLIMAGWLLLGGVARGDVLHLVNGVKVEGIVVKTEHGYQVKTKGGVTTFPAHAVLRWEKKLTLLQEYDQRNAKLAADDFTGNVELGDWAARKGLGQQARWHRLLAVAIRPDDARARGHAGYSRDGDGWISLETRMKRKGFSRYKGKWLPESKATLKRIRDEKNIAARYAYKQTWALLRRESLRRSSHSITDTIAKLLALGRPALPYLKQASIDPFKRIREVSLATLGRADDREAASILLERMKTERNKSVLRKSLIPALKLRPERMAVLEGLLDLAVNNRRSGLRKRGRKALREIGDTRVIPSLITRVSSTMDAPVVHGTEALPEKDNGEADTPPPTDGAANKQRKEHLDMMKKRLGAMADKVDWDAVKLPDGPAKSRTRDKPRYSAHRALLYLTGQTFPPEIKPWEAWWSEHGKDFSLNPKTWIQSETQTNPPPRKKKKIRRLGF